MEYVPLVMALAAVALILLALVLMARDEILLAGLSFLSASLMIYFRESRLN